MRIFIMAIIALLLAGCASITPCPQPVPHKPSKAVRFATYNVYWQNNNHNKYNPHSIMSIIREINPDILVLQETHNFSHQRLDRAFLRSHHYRLFKNGNKNGSEDGLGILSRYPIIKSWYFPPVYGWFPGWLYLIKTPLGYVQVLNVHLNPKLIRDNDIGLFAEGLWLTPSFRLQEITYYYRYLNPCLPVLIAGDFNENDNGSASKFLRNHHFCDVLLRIPKYLKTWHYQWGPLQLTGRYDRIYHTPNLRAIHYQILHKGYSDHYPVFLDYTTGCSLMRRGS